MANQIQSSKRLSTVTTARNYLCTFFTFCKLLVLTKSKKSHTGDLHIDLSLGFGATGLESGTSSAEVVKPVDVVSSAEVTVSSEVTVEVVIVTFNNDDGGTSIAEDKGEDIYQ